MTSRAMAMGLAAAAAVATLTLGSTSFAQRTTGILLGFITDSSGARLPGVTVTISGASGLGEQTAVSNDTGLYRFADLPPGTYDVVFTLQGFAPMKLEGLRVGVAQTVEQNVTLNVGQFTETVTVSGEGPVIDTQTSKVSTVLTEDFLENTPTTRASWGFHELLNVAPGVTQGTKDDYRVSVFGSNGNENAYRLDGMDFGSPGFGQAYFGFNPDLIQEVEVMTLGSPAEYGGGVGGTFNIVTRSGGNDFNGEASFYWQPDALTGRNTTEEQDGGLPYTRVRFNDYSAVVGGPIKKDRAWFLVNWNFKRDESAALGTDPNFPEKNPLDEIYAKINFQINDNHRIMGSLERQWLGYADPGDALTSVTARAEGGWDLIAPNVTYNGILSSDTLVETRFSGFHNKEHWGFAEGQPEIDTRFYDLDTGAVSGGPAYIYEDIDTRFGVHGKVSHFADDFMGASHDFKFGMEFRHGGTDGALTYQDIVYTYQYGGSTYAYGYTQVPYTYAAYFNTVGLFADDSIIVNPRLSLNLGVRYDYTKGYNPELDLLDDNAQPTGQTVPRVDRYVWNNFSPRLGFNYKLTADGENVLKGHYGRYYRGAVSGDILYLGGSITPRFLGLYDLSTGTFFDLEQTSRPGLSDVDPDYRTPYTDQFSLSYEREVAENVGFNAIYTYKRGRDFPGYRDVGGVYLPVTYLDTVGTDPTGDPVTVYQLQNSPEERRFQLTNREELNTSYHGVVFEVTKRMSNNWQLSSSVVLSRAEGALPGSRGGPGASVNNNVGTFGQNPNDFVNIEGRLTQDRPVVFKTQFVFRLPWDMMIGANYVAQTGRAWARHVRPPLDLVVLPSEINAVPPGDNRVPNWNLLDLRFQKDVVFSERFRAGLFVDVLNVFNSDTNESVLTNLGTSSNYGIASGFMDPRRALIGFKVKF